MVTSKLTILLCTAILTCHCQESATKRPTGNTTSQPEKESGSKPTDAKPAVQKLAKQMARPEHSPNNPGEQQDTRQGRSLNNPGQNQPAVRYQGQPPLAADPSTYRRPLDQNQPQPAYQRNPISDPRQRRRLDQDPNQDSPNEGMNSVPYYGRPEADQSTERQRRVRYQDPSRSQDEQSFKPYSFNYISETEEAMTSHQQAADASGRVSGSYSMSLGDGRKRVVDYVADENGFRANVDTNEPGTSSSENPAHTVFSSSNPNQLGHEFRGTTNPIQPQPQAQVRPNPLRPGSDGYRTETRITSSVSGPFGGNYGWTSESQPGRSPTQFRGGREDMAEAGVTSDEGRQQDPNRIRGVQRLGRDQFQGAPDAAVNRVPYNPLSSPPLRSDRGYQNRPSSTLPRDNINPNIPNTGRDERQLLNNQPTMNRTPLNTIPSSEGQSNTGEFDRSNRGLQYNPSQPSDYTPSEWRNAGNEPSYRGWFRPSSGPREENPAFRAQRDSFPSGAQPEQGNGLEYQPVIRNGNARSPHQPTWTPSRSNADDPQQNIQPTAGRYSPRSESYPRPQYNRNEQPQPNPQMTSSRPQDSFRRNANPLNIPQSNYDRSNLPVEGAVQSTPDVQRGGERSEFIIPQTIASSGEMPQGYRNYGTYWYYGN